MMIHPRFPITVWYAPALILIVLTVAICVQAQTPATALVTRAIDESRTITLPGTVHPLALARYDVGAAEDSFPAGRILLQLNRPPEREAALDQFMRDVHTPGSSSYHHWVTPEEFGERFGPADTDIQMVVNWLQAHGFNVPRVTKSKGLIEFSGTAGQLRQALHADIHQYSINGQTHYANASEITVPEALAPLIKGFSPMNDFRAKSYLRTLGAAQYTRDTHQVTPLWTLGTRKYAFAPEDFATQYDVSPLYTAGTDGTGQTIGIINESNIDISLVNAYRTLFNLPANPTQVVIDGNDPGEIPGVDVEAYLDVEVSGAVAPKATVILYISGSQLTDPLSLAALRAIEDNQASVLSTSFGVCEADLGAGGNQLWYGLWEQAAAQGQTPFVSAGDGGPAGCDNFDSTALAQYGLAVSGLASTPWNVAVGGTDFYYSDYATGAPSVATLWNRTNDSNLGSLKATLPEQPWNNAFGLNAEGDQTTIVAGSGGASSCVQSVQYSNGEYNCEAGYPKPSWQSAPGVPADGVRDVPDVSLFAANGVNYSSYPICAFDGECASGTNAIGLVGGTSASSPAMAGIMALVNQKYGRQGQANNTLYALAQQQPAAFHDVTIGGNNVPCEQGTPNCSLDKNDAYYSLQEYSAGPGYDMASGLGTIDAAKLVNSWNQITFLPTTSTLTLSPATVVHGTAVTINAKVAPASGPGTPTGDIDIAITSPIPLPKSGAVPLTSGAASGSINYFPGGTYQVSATYGGDSSYAVSTSSPETLTVTPEPSIINLTTMYLTGDAFGPILNGMQVAYGSWLGFEAQPSGTTGIATGAVTFTDGTNATQVAIDSVGAAEWYPALSVGSHSIIVSYSGDASFQASSTQPLTLTVVKNIPNIAVETLPPGATPPPAGSTLNVNVSLHGTSQSVTAPTGTVNVTLGAVTKTATLIADGHGISTGTVAFPSLATGSYSLSAKYLGDSNWNGTISSNQTVTVAASSLLASTTTLSISPTSVTGSSLVTLAVTVQGSGGASAPSGMVAFYINGMEVAWSSLVSGNATTARAQFILLGQELFVNGTNQVMAFYEGDSAFSSSDSAPVTVNADLRDFSLVFPVSQLVLAAGNSASVTLNLGSLTGSETVTLTCTTSSSSLGCTVPSTPLTVNGNATATVTITTYMSVSGLQKQHSGGRFLWIRAGSVGMFAFVFLLGCGKRQRGWRMLLGINMIVVLALVIGCGGGSVSSVQSAATATPTPTPTPQSSASPTPTPTPTSQSSASPTPTPTPQAAATVGSVLVTGTGSNGTVHTVRLTVLVQ